MAYIDLLSELEEVEEGEKPWADFVFDIVSMDADKGPLGGYLRSLAIEMRASHPEGNVGLRMRVPAAAWPGKDDDGFAVYWGHVVLESIGAPSDRLVRVYESWWELPSTSTPAISSLTVQAAGINSTPENALNEIVHTKLFFDPHEPSPNEDEENPAYGQLFFNFDLSARRAWLREKDKGYRCAVIGWLMGRYRAERER